MHGALERADAGYEFLIPLMYSQFHIVAGVSAISYDAYIRSYASQISIHRQYDDSIRVLRLTISLNVSYVCIHSALLKVPTCSTRNISTAIM